MSKVLDRSGWFCCHAFVYGKAIRRSLRTRDARGLQRILDREILEGRLGVLRRYTGTAALPSVYRKVGDGE